MKGFNIEKKYIGKSCNQVNFQTFYMLNMVNDTSRKE